jgi:hypothetical protein
MSDHHDNTYHSNPFRTTVSQLSLLLKTNPISTLTLGLLMILVAAGGIMVLALFAGALNSTFGDVLAVLLGIVFFVLVVFRFAAASYYLHLAAREGRSLTARQSLDEAAKQNFGQFALTAFVTALLIILGFVALIVPGIFLMGRLVFAPYVALYEKADLTTALKRSWQLSDGHWFEVFGAFIASAILLPNGLLSFVGQQSGLAGRYFELDHLKKSGAQKPEVHWMNYLLTGLAIITIFFYAAVFRNAGNIDSNLQDDLCRENSIFCDDDRNPYRSSDSIFDYDSSPTN